MAEHGCSFIDVFMLANRD